MRPDDILVLARFTGLTALRFSAGAHDGHGPVLLDDSSATIIARLTSESAWLLSP